MLLSKGDYDKATSYYVKALKIREQIRDSAGIASSTNNLGMIFYKQQKFENAINYYHQALNINRKQKMLKKEALILLNLGNIYDEIDQYDSSVYYYQKSIIVAEQSDDLRSIAMAYGNMGVSQGKLGNYVIAVKCEEYRNGNKIGEVNREIELTSFNCNTIFTTYTDTVCGSFRTIGGKIISNSGTYYDTTQTSLGCDSIIKYNITIKYLDTSTTFLNPAIKSNDTSALYQWLDCGNSYAPIIGATGQTYAIIGNGSYAVEVKNNNCIDTSSCFIINNVGEYEKRIVNLIQLYPNPSKGIYNLSLKEEINVVRLYITDIKGRLIKEITPQKALKYEINFNGTSGIYFLNVLTKNTVTTIKLIKK